MDPSLKIQVPSFSIPPPHETFTDMFISQLRTIKRSTTTICRSLEAISNRMDGYSFVGIPLVPKCRVTGEGARLTSLTDFDLHAQMLFLVLQTLDGP